MIQLFIISSPSVNANNGLVYMVARLAQNYSVLLQIFNEVRTSGKVGVGSGVCQRCWVTVIDGVSYFFCMCISKGLLC